MEKRIEGMSSATCERSSGGVGKGRCPRPRISMLETPARRVPFLQTFVLLGTNLRGGEPNAEIGGRGNLLLVKQKTPPTISVLFSPNIVLLQYPAPI